MLEIKITAPEISEAINNLAKAISLATTTPTGMMNGAVPSNTTCAAAEKSAPAPVQPMAPVVPVNTAPTTPAPAMPVVPTAAAPNPAPAPTVPTSAPQYTLDMIATAGSALIDAGKMDQLMQLLGKFGVTSLTELAPENYGAVANELRTLGAAI